MQITITVQVNETTWANEYGVESEEVRADVASFVRNALNQASVPMKVTVK